MEAGYPETQNKKDSIARTFVVLLDGLQMTITDTLKKKKINHINCFLFANTVVFKL